MSKALALAALLLAAPASRAAAQEDQAQRSARSRSEMTAPLAPQSVKALRDAFVEAIEKEDKQRALTELARTPPETSSDLTALYDLFMRYENDAVRQAALDSLQLMSPAAQAAEPMIMRYLTDEEPASVLFGIKASLRLRLPAALPVLKQIASRKIKPQAVDRGGMSERNNWWAQYEALAALAQWQGAEALPVLKKKAAEAPAVARIMGLFLWEESLEQIAAWSRGDDRDKAKAISALDAPAGGAALRATRVRMLELVRDPKSPEELRHKLALKAGAVSLPEEVALLLKEHDATADPKTRRLLAAAAFASRDSQIVPLLTKFVKEDPAPGVRAAARLQLGDMLSPDKRRELLRWVSESDPDAGNRELAKRELALLKN